MRQNSPEAKVPTARLRCAIYTRKSTEEGLEQDFNSLDAQREGDADAGRDGRGARFAA